MSSVLPIRSLARGLDVLQIVSQEGLIKKSQISRAVGLPYATVNRIVHTLVEEGYLELETDKRLIRVTAKVQSLSQGFQKHDRLVEVARPFLVGLTNRLDWPVTIATRLGGSMVVRDSTHENTSMTFRHIYPGFVFSVLDSAAGRAYLAFCSSEEREGCLRAIAASDTKGALSHAIELASDGTQLEVIRKEYLAVTPNASASVREGRNAALASPIFDGSGVCGSLALVYFASAMPSDQAVNLYANDIKEAAEEISTRMAEY